MADDWPGDMPDEFRKGAAFAERIAADEIAALRARVAELEAENTDLRTSVIAFCGPWAATYARDHGLPERHLDATHYDILAKAGARMDDFVRHEP